MRVLPQKVMLLRKTLVTIAAVSYGFVANAADSKAVASRSVANAPAASGVPTPAPSPASSPTTAAPATPPATTATSAAQPSPSASASVISSTEVKNPAPTTAKAASKKIETSLSIQETTTVKAIRKTGGTNKAEEQLIEEGSPIPFEDDKSLLAGLDYPELQVVPKASERLNMEIQADRNSIIGNYWAVQVSAVALMVAGSNAAGKYREENLSTDQKKENQFASQMGLLFGGMWISTSLYVDYSFSYNKSLNEIKKITGKDKKSALLRERMAEEALERPAKMARVINNFAVWTNFALAVYINSQSKQGLPNYAALAMGLSFLPWMIENRLVENWDKHLEYKRKIYAPITKIDFHIDSESGRATPLLGLQWRF